MNTKSIELEIKYLYEADATAFPDGSVYVEGTRWQTTADSITEWARSQRERWERGVFLHPAKPEYPKTFKNGTLHAYTDLGPEFGINHSIRPFLTVTIGEDGEYAQYDHTLYVDVVAGKRKRDWVSYRVTQRDQWHEIEIDGQIVYSTQEYPLLAATTRGHITERMRRLGLYKEADEIEARDRN